MSNLNIVQLNVTKRALEAIKEQENQKEYRPILLASDNERCVNCGENIKMIYLHKNLFKKYIKCSIGYICLSCAKSIIDNTLNNSIDSGHIIRQGVTERQRQADQGHVAGHGHMARRGLYGRVRGGGLDNL